MPGDSGLVGSTFSTLTRSRTTGGGLTGSGAASGVACTLDRGAEGTVTWETGSATGGGIDAALTASGFNGSADLVLAGAGTGAADRAATVTAWAGASGTVSFCPAWTP